MIEFRQLVYDFDLDLNNFYETKSTQSVILKLFVTKLAMTKFKYLEVK
jgi:hypothetical protein